MFVEVEVVVGMLWCGYDGYVNGKGVWMFAEVKVRVFCL